MRNTYKRLSPITHITHNYHHSFSHLDFGKTKYIRVRVIKADKPLNTTGKGSNSTYNQFQH